MPARVYKIHENSVAPSSTSGANAGIGRETANDMIYIGDLAVGVTHDVELAVAITVRPLYK